MSTPKQNAAPKAGTALTQFFELNQVIPDELYPSQQALL
jgi:hypothetical protein